MSERDPWDRVRFWVEQEDVDPTDVVVIDEVGSNLDMPPRYARAPRGERTVAAVPHNTPPTTTTISALTSTGMGPSRMTVGSVTADVFAAYGEHVVVPTLRPGQIVLLDHLTVYKSLRVREELASCGCWLWYLPTYSRDCSPIELAIAKIKAELRRVGARTREMLDDAVAHALTHSVPDEARAFFTHGGFRFRCHPDQWFCS